MPHGGAVPLTFKVALTDHQLVEPLAQDALVEVRERLKELRRIRRRLRHRDHEDHHRDEDRDLDARHSPHVEPQLGRGN